jgi:hypothetical protein
LTYHTKENDMNNPIHATELVELINEKSREHSNPQNRFEYFNLMAQLARHEARHAEVSLMNKHKHVHADLMAAYAADAQTTVTPWELWEARDTKSHYPDNGRWYTLKSDPSWNPSFAYRRKPKQHTVTLNTKENDMEYTIQELRHMVELLDMLAARQAATHVVAEDALLARRRNILLILEAAEIANKWRTTITEQHQTSLNLT